MAEWWEAMFASGAYTVLEGIPQELTGDQVDFAAGALALGAGMRVLDLCCGIGRHSLPFAAAGLEVVGLDLCHAYLESAAATAGRYGAGFVRGDMQRLPFGDACFDAVVCLFSSWGYFAEDRDNAGVIAEVGRTLRPEGGLLLDVLNRDALVRTFVPRDWTQLPGGLMLEERSWDAVRGRVETRWTFHSGGRAEGFDVSIRIYTLPEVDAMLAAAGLKRLAVWGDWDGSPFAMESRRMLVLAQRPAE